MKNGVMGFLCVGALCCCDVERADGEAVVEGGLPQRFEATVQKAIRGNDAEAEKVADLWSATLGTGSDEERFHRASSVLIFLQSKAVANAAEIASHAEDALRSPQCGRDAAPLVKIIFIVAEEEAESRLAGFYSSLNKAARVAVLGVLKELRGAGYSAEPFTERGETVEEAYQNLEGSDG